jgi:hypothetical protein
MSTPRSTRAEVPAPAHNHGRTRAAWVTNGGIVLGALILSIGVAVPSYPLVWAGSAVIVASLITGLVMKFLGHGQPRH